MSAPKAPSEQVTDNGAIAERLGRRVARSNRLPRFFTIAQVAELLQVSTRTVRRWIDDELLVAHSPGGILRIAEADLLAFLAENRGA
jgi:excisionase family DNA binding protein